MPIAVFPKLVGVCVGVGVGVVVGVCVGVVEVVPDAYMLMAPVTSLNHMVPNGLVKPFVYELYPGPPVRWPVPVTMAMFTGMLPIIASP